MDQDNPFLPPRSETAARTRNVAKSGSDNGLVWVLFSFNGRIPRRQYWGALIAAAAAFVVAVYALAVILGPSAALSVLNLLYVPLIWSTLAVQAKRWHDRGKSGGWVAINFIPIVGAVWVLIELGCLRGTVGTNPYGPDPT